MDFSLGTHETEVLVALSTRRLRMKDLLEQLTLINATVSETTARRALGNLVKLGLVADTAAMIGERRPKWARTSLGDDVVAGLVVAATARTPWQITR